MSRTAEVRARQRGRLDPCQKNPNGYDYHRDHHRTETLDDDRVRSWVVCEWCGRIRDEAVCPPHSPTTTYACPGWLKMTTCASCLVPLDEAHL